MNIDFIHPHSSDFPGNADGTVWETAEMYPIGVVQLEKDGEWVPLAQAKVGRNRLLFAIINGEAQPLDMEVAGQAFYEALSETCTRLWGYSWNAAIGDIFGFNRRTLQRDRLVKFMLPPRVLMTIAYINSTVADGEPLPDLLRVIGRYKEWRGTQGQQDIVERYLLSGTKLFYEQDEDVVLGMKI